MFTYSPRVHGVHLRFGAVARGGLRWSDRREDFRTEVLGLVKAQMVKNTVIVPVGAKGGFVPQRLPAAARPRSLARRGTRLLPAVRRRAAQRHRQHRRRRRWCRRTGWCATTATTPTWWWLRTRAPPPSPTSPTRSRSAAASGWGTRSPPAGPAGYDHKAMGITARGAWESVKRHFTELGLDPGDRRVHLRRHRRHGRGRVRQRHAALGPASGWWPPSTTCTSSSTPIPDPATSFAERRRLFGLPGSTWADYDPSLISAGGGVYRRDAKSMPI